VLVIVSALLLGQHSFFKLRSRARWRLGPERGSTWSRPSLDLVRTLCRRGADLCSIESASRLDHVQTFSRPCPHMVPTVSAPSCDRVRTVSRQGPLVRTTSCGLCGDRGLSKVARWSGRCRDANRTTPPVGRLRSVTAIHGPLGEMSLPLTSPSARFSAHALSTSARRTQTPTKNRDKPRRRSQFVGSTQCQPIVDIVLSPGITVWGPTGRGGPGFLRDRGRLCRPRSRRFPGW